LQGSGGMQVLWKALAFGDEENLGGLWALRHKVLCKGLVLLDRPGHSMSVLCWPWLLSQAFSSAWASGSVPKVSSSLEVPHLSLLGMLQAPSPPDHLSPDTLAF
jgi:hypothetical protein